jgi:predicted SnoaL-like aldol condensation-catalyzing enzyme
LSVVNQSLSPNEFLPFFVTPTYTLPILSEEATMSAASQPVSTPEQAKHLVLRWFEEVWNQNRREVIFELFAANGVLHDGAVTYHGPDEFAAFHDALRAQLSNMHIEPIVPPLAEGDRVCLHWRATGTHTATGKETDITGTSLVRIENGQFVEAWQNWDAGTMHTQLTGQAILQF